MTMAKVRVACNLLDPQFKLVTLLPGDEIPAWALGRITNSAVIDDGFTVAEEPVAVVAPEPDVPAVAEPDYSRMRKAELQALLEERGLDASGTVDQLRKRLAAADTEELVQDEEVDLWELSEAELRALADARGIDVGDASTTGELAALILVGAGE